MKFSDYLRTLDEGNLGHELEKQEAAKPKVGKNLQKIASNKPAETADDNAKRADWKASLRPTGDDGGAKAERENTVKEPSGEVMNDPKTGKPFPKTGPLKDWQIPSLKEDWRQTDPGHTREDEEDVPDKPVDTKKWNGHGKEPEGYEDAGGPIDSEGNAALRKKPAMKKPAMKKPAMKPVNDSIERPTRDALGRLSIYAINEKASDRTAARKMKKLDAVAEDPKSEMNDAVNAADESGDMKDAKAKRTAEKGKPSSMFGN
jgi:hypothetical protein